MLRTNQPPRLRAVQAFRVCRQHLLCKNKPFCFANALCIYNLSVSLLICVYVCIYTLFRCCHNPMKFARLTIYIHINIYIYIYIYEYRLSLQALTLASRSRPILSCMWLQHFQPKVETMVNTLRKNQHDEPNPIQRHWRSDTKVKERRQRASRETAVQTTYMSQEKL